MISTLSSNTPIETNSTIVTTLEENSFQTIEDDLFLWLEALKSFLQLSNLPVSNIGEQQLAQRDWTGEMRVVYWGLLQILQLTARYSPTDNAKLAKALALQKLLQDSADFSHSLINQGKITFIVWNSWNNSFKRELKEIDAEKIFDEKAANHTQSLTPALELLAHHPFLQGILGTDVSEIIKSFFVLLGRLKLIEEMLKRDQPLKSSLLLFALINQETRAVLKQIENTLQLLPSNSPLYDVLDGTLYVTPLELRKVFAHELINVVEIRQAPTVFARVENACGLLKDCFQQAVVAIAQVFAPQFQGNEIFSNYLTRLEQSKKLRSELWKLLRFVQNVQKSSDAALLPNLNAQLKSFRENTMSFLMFKDFETIERFVEEISRTRQHDEIIQVLHRFAAYLETLLGQVNMRNVLADHPFDYPEVTF